MNLERTSSFFMEYKNTESQFAVTEGHYHDAYEIMYYKRAELDFFIKDNKYHIKDGDIVFIRAYELHRSIYHTSPHYERYVINFKKEYILPLLKASGALPLFEQLEKSPVRRFSTTLKHRNELESVMQEIYKQYQKSGETRELLLKVNFLFLLAKLDGLRKHTAPQQGDCKEEQVKRLIQAIDKSYAQALTLDELAAQMNLNKYHMCHIFKEITGFTIIEYLQYRRVIAAQKLLVSTEKSIDFIGSECGFGNLHHFYRVFKTIAGNTPARYRKEKQTPARLPVFETDDL